MAFWIFKLSLQEQYADEMGRTYVYDNRHSVRVMPGDSFVYLDKRYGGYGFAGHGVVAHVTAVTTEPAAPDQASIGRIYTAGLCDFFSYSRLLDIRPASVEGKKNRAMLGIGDANKLGWSRSIARISFEMFSNVVGLAYEQKCVPIAPLDSSNYAVPDAWSYGRRRHHLERFKEAVLLRQGAACAICGTILAAVLEVAHISSYATDIDNRANPANGIGLCAYCHRAFDKRAFELSEDGTVSMAASEKADLVARAHLSNLPPEARLRLLDGISWELLRQR